MMGWHGRQMSGQQIEIELMEINSLSQYSLIHDLALNC